MSNYGGLEQCRLQLLNRSQFSVPTPFLHIKKTQNFFFFYGSAGSDIPPYAAMYRHVVVIIIYPRPLCWPPFFSTQRRMTTYLEAVCPWGFCLLKDCSFFAPRLFLLVWEHFLTADRRGHRDVLFFGVAFTSSRTVEWEMDRWFSLVL